MEKLNSISELIKSLENDPDFAIEKEQLMNRSRDESGEIIEKEHSVIYKIKTNNIQCFKEVSTVAWEILGREEVYISNLIDEVIKGNDREISFTVLDYDLPIPEQYEFIYNFTNIQ